MTSAFTRGLRSLPDQLSLGREDQNFFISQYSEIFLPHVLPKLQHEPQDDWVPLLSLRLVWIMYSCHLRAMCELCYACDV